METRTIAPNGYQSFFDSLSRIYQGSSATLELLANDLGAQHEVDEQPLRGISYDRSGIDLYLTAGDGTHLVHRIARPKRVQVEENDEGLIEAVAIESDGDPRAVLSFHSPVASRLLTAGS